MARSMEALEIPFEEIESATNNFADENLIAVRASSSEILWATLSEKIYRGQLRKSEQKIDIAVLKCEMGYDFSGFFMEKTMKLFLLEHENIKSILHFSWGNRTTIFLVNKIEANGSLAKHLPAGSTLTWKQRLRICTGVAEALKYVHNTDVMEPGHYLIHGNIKSSKILLDENWQPKLQGFESAMVAERNTRYVTSNYKGTLQYKDPAYETTGGLTDKSDVFSFGVVLFEVLFGRKAASTPNEQKDNWNFAEFARLHWKNKTLDKMIDPDLRKNMDTESIKIFSDVAYACLTGQREDRPNMDQVVRALKRSLEFQQYHERLMVSVTETSSKHLQGKSFEHLMIPLKDILLATENFHSKNKIGSGGFGIVYKAKLDHFDNRNPSTVEGGDDGGDKHKLCSTVAIKRISSTQKAVGEKGFIAEVTMLSNCRHPNIVSLLGFCDEDHEKILIYEYVPNGSLDGYLEHSYRMTKLTWGRRIQICLDIAEGLKYLHSGLNGNERIIHRDIKSANVLLDNNLRAKIADFGLSRLYTIDSKNSTINTINVAGTNLYLDPEYDKTGKLKTASDIYSFGVVLFEILCGTLANDRIYSTDTGGLPSIARRLFKEGKSKTIVDPSVKDTDGSIFSHNRGADQQSLDTFLSMANQCLAETQDERPKMEDVIRELEKALNFQKNSKENLQILLEDINLATQNFSDCNCIGEGKFWKQYKGDVPQAISNAKGSTAIVAKRWNKSGQGHQQFFRELEFVFKHKHENVIDLVGYCTEMEEKIIVYEHSSKGSLDKYLKDKSLSWMERLKICIDVASGLEFLHSGGPQENVMMHGDIKSGSILIDGNGKAKISNLELITTDTFNQQTESLCDADGNSTEFLDPSIVKRGNVSKESDIYSLGVLLFEVLSGRLAKEEGSLGPLAIRWELDEMVFEGIKDQIDPYSFDVFTYNAHSCFKTASHGQPNASDVLTRLKDALKFQIDIEDIPKTALKNIKLGSDDKCIQEGRYWKLYDAQVQQDNANGWATVFAKRWDNKSRQAHALFLTELRNLLECKNKHIVALVGYCNELNEKIIFYEHASNGSLDKHLDDPSFNWKKRLNICNDVASGLQCLHKSGRSRVFSGNHNVIKSGSILIDGDWKGKIANLEYYPHIWSSFPCPEAHCPKESVDVYALGVVLLEILCGRSAWPEGCEDHSQSLGPLAQQHYKEKGNLDELVFKGIEEQIHPASLILFQRIALKCLGNDWGLLEPLHVVEIQLRKALEVEIYVEGSSQLSLEDIKQGTQNFSDDKCVGEGRHWKLYEGKFPDANADGYATALVKRWASKSREARHEFFTELGFLSQYKNDDNIIGIEGYCNEMDEKIIVYEHGFNRSLNKHLDDASLSWTKRLRICIDTAEVVQSLYRDGIGIRDIKSRSILIDSDWKGKVSNLELNLMDLTSRQQELEYYDSDNELLVVLLEILCGRLDWGEGCQSLKSLAERHYVEKRNLDELVFEVIKEKIAPESLNLFIEIVSNCLEKRSLHERTVRIRARRPPALHNLLYTQKTWYSDLVDLVDSWEEQKYVEETPELSLDDVKLATQNFSDDKCVGQGRYWKLYEGEFPDANDNGYTTALVKRWDTKSSQGRQQFFRVLRIHFHYKNNGNIIAAVKGYCSEKDEKIIVFEHAYAKSLDKHLDDTSLSWTKRLNICIDVASVLDLFFNNRPSQVRVILGDIKSGSILIDGDWKAKVFIFEVFASLREWATDKTAHSSLGYFNPQYQGSGWYNIYYALGVVLLEMLCGRLAWPEGCEDHSRSLGPLAQRHYMEKGNLDELVFEGIKEQIAPKSLTTFQEIALKCLGDRGIKQPDAKMVVEQLKNASELQEDHERWNSKLPKEYKNYIQMSKNPEIYSTEAKKELHDMLTKGILLQQDQRLFTLGANGERNEMISSTKFAYKNRPLRIWQSIPESRFQKVAQMLDISNLKIQIRIKTQLLSPGVNYGVYLVFKFYGSRKSAAKRVYVNLSYKMGKDNLHAYFATWRDDEWMMIELCRISNDKNDSFGTILKSFSRCYCASRIIYVEGIEFRAIDKVNYVQQVLKSSSHIDEVQQSPIEGHEIFNISGNDEDDKIFSVNKENGKKDLTLSPIEFLSESSNVKSFDLNPSSVSRSQAVEFLPQQVFGIKCKIESQMLSPDTDYICYLVFKFSEKCNGLHGPVIIRDLLKWKNKETGIVYFRSPNPWNLHDTDWVPIGRKDGWMEVTVWKFNSKSELRNDCVPMNLKLITYEGTMSGLIVCSLEIRPI